MSWTAWRSGVSGVAALISTAILVNSFFNWSKDLIDRRQAFLALSAKTVHSLLRKQHPRRSLDQSSITTFFQPLARRSIISSYLHRSSSLRHLLVSIIAPSISGRAAKHTCTDCYFGGKKCEAFVIYRGEASLPCCIGWLIPRRKRTRDGARFAC